LACLSYCIWLRYVPWLSLLVICCIHTYKHISRTLSVTVSKVFDEIPQPEKVLKRHQNRDDPCIMAWDHYKSQSLWLKVKDRNTKFFHNQAKERQSRNNVSSIGLEDGSQVTYFANIKIVAKRHFADLFSMQEEVEGDLFCLSTSLPLSLTTKIWPSLNQSQEANIFASMWSLGSGESPRFIWIFYFFLQYLWNLIKYDLKCMLHYSHQSLRLGGNTNSSFLALVPKESNPTSFTRL
jgi:hypothetical protein